jgi:hypothetical protein
MQTHRLNTIARYFDAVERGEKTFEVRKNDRAFQTGDILELVRTDGDHMAPRDAPSLRKQIIYLLQGGQFGIEPAYCVLGLGDVPADKVIEYVKSESVLQRFYDHIRDQVPLWMTPSRLLIDDAITHICNDFPATPPMEISRQIQSHVVKTRFNERRLMIALPHVAIKTETHNKILADVALLLEMTVEEVNGMLDD